MIACTVRARDQDFQAMLDDPKAALSQFQQGKIQATGNAEIVTRFHLLLRWGRPGGNPGWRVPVSAARAYTRGYLAMQDALVIFDFDGTIADSFGESLLAYNRVAPRLRLRPMVESEVSELRRMTIGQLMTALEIPMWKLPRLMIAVRADLIEHFQTVKPIRGIPRALRELRAAGYRLAIVTGNSKANVRAFLTRYDLDVFPTIVAGTSIFGKAMRLRRLLRAARLDSTRCAYVGDAAPDIRAAREAGTLALAVTWGFAAHPPLAAEHPDAVVDHPAELPPTIARLLGAGRAQSEPRGRRTH